MWEKRTQSTENIQLFFINSYLVKQENVGGGDTNVRKT